MAESPDRLFSLPLLGRETKRGEKSCSFFFKAVSMFVLAWVMNSKPRSEKCEGHVFPRDVNWKKLARELVYSRGNKLLGNKIEAAVRVRRVRRRLFSRISCVIESRYPRSIGVLYLEVKFRVPWNQWILLRRCCRRSLSNFDARRPVKRPHCGYVGFSTAFSPAKVRQPLKSRGAKSEPFKSQCLIHRSEWSASRRVSKLLVRLKMTGIRGAKTRACKNDLRKENWQTIRSDVQGTCS